MQIKNMDIIFGYISYWSLPIIIILKYLGFNVYYIYIATNNDTKKK